MGDYAAAIEAQWQGDSLIGFYHNVGNHGPRVIPFRAARGRWPAVQAPSVLVGQWDATWLTDWSTSPRVLEFRQGADGLEGTVISNSGDYGLFAGSIEGDSISMAHFDGSFVYLLTFRQSGDTLRGTFHAGLRGETRWIATRSTGAAPPDPSDRGHEGRRRTSRSPSPFPTSRARRSPIWIRASRERS